MNIEILRDAASGDFAFARELAREYLDFMAVQFRLLHQALEGGATSQIEHAAHLAMGSSLTCGALQAGALFRRLEHAAREGRLDALPALLAAAEDEVALERQRLHELLFSRAGPGDFP